MSETIVRSSPYRRSDCITIVYLLELKSAAQRYLFDCSLSCAAHPCEAARGNYVWPRPLGGGGKNLGCCRSHGYSAYFVQSVRTHTHAKRPEREYDSESYFGNRLGRVDCLLLARSL